MKEPLLCMLLLIFGMFMVAFICRMYSIRSGNVRFKHYELFALSEEPAYVKKTTNNLNNLFQLPPIFIAACVLALALHIESNSLIFNSWGFVISRYLHTIVHITYNKVAIRATIFSVGVYFLVSMWLEIYPRI